MRYPGITRREYFNGEKGCVERRTNRLGADVALYHAGQAGFERVDYLRPWVTICFTHGRSETHPSLREARQMLAHSDYWCEECAQVLRKRWVEKKLAEREAAERG